MAIPELNDFEGLRTYYSESELRAAIAIAEAIRKMPGGGGGGGGGSGDATAANQVLQTTELQAIKNRLPTDGALSEGADITGAAIPVGGAGGRGWLSAIWKLIGDRLPASLNNGKIDTISNAPLPTEIVGSASANNTDLFSANVAEYKFASVQIYGTFTATCILQFSNNGIDWTNAVFYNNASLNNFLSTITSPAIASGSITAKFFRVRTTAYTSGTINASILLYKSTPIPIAKGGTVAISGSVTVGGTTNSGIAHDGSIGTSFPTIIAANARTVNYTAVANDDAARLVCSTVGALVSTPWAIPENYISGINPTAMATTVDTQILAARATGIRNYVLGGVVTNSSAVATLVEIKDGAAVVARLFAAANSCINFSFPSPIRGSPATAVNAACVTTGSNTYVTLVGFVAP